MSTFKRAFFRCQTDPTSNLTVDLLIDTRRRWVEKVPTAGWWGTIRSDNIWPFIIYENGKIDFGNTPDEPTLAASRFGSLAISDRIIAEGERYEFEYDGQYYMVLEKLTDLTELLSIS